MDCCELIIGYYLVGIWKIDIFVKWWSVLLRWFMIWGVCENNFKNIDVLFLLFLLCVVIGVSGVGKSIFINEIFVFVIFCELYGSFKYFGDYDCIEGG